MRLGPRSRGRRLRRGASRRSSRSPATRPSYAWLRSVLQHSQQEGTRLVPLTSHGTFRGAGEIGYFLFCVAGEVAHLDHLRQHGVDLFQREQCILESDERRLAFPDGKLVGEGGIQTQVGASTSTSLCELLACELENDVAHRFGRIGEEVLPIDERELL